MFEQQNQAGGSQQQQQQPQLDPNKLRWDYIATTDQFRSLDTREQNKLSRLWLRDVAPKLNPKFNEDKQVRKQLSEYAYNFRLPKKLEGEESVVQPDTLHMDGISKVEENPEFARMDYKEQQQIRSIWYHKMAANDPKFQEMSLEEQKAYYNKLLKRPPSYSSGAAKALWDNKSGFFMPLREDMKDQTDWEDVVSKARVIATNSLGSFGRGVASLVTGPLSMITGPDSGISRALADVQKEKEWINAATDYNVAGTEVIPNIVGEMAGLITGPYGKLMRGLAGGTKLVKGAKGASKLSKTPGLFGTAAAKVSPKIPQLGAEIAGGATAGALYGISSAIHENKSWDTYLLRDATLGVGMEFLTRYFGAIRQIKKAAKQTGTNVDELFRKPFDVRAGKVMSDEMEKVVSANPELSEVMNFAKATDENGLLRKWTETKDGLDAKARVLGLNIDDTDEGLKIAKTGKSGEPEVLQIFEGPEQVKIHKANDWLDDQDQIWENITKGKSTYEAIMNSPEVELRRTTSVPDVSRKKLMEQFDTHDVKIGADHTIDPRGDTAFIDKVHNIIYHKSANKASKSLRSMGIVFDEDPKINAATIDSMKKELRQIMPDRPSIIVNEKTKQLIDKENMPLEILESPDVMDSFYNSNVFTGNPRNVRALLDTVVKKKTGAKQATSKKASGMGVRLEKIADEDTVEMHVKVPGKQGQPLDAVIHFHTMNQARSYLSKAEGKGLKGISDILYKEDDTIQQSYKQFVKNFKKTNPERFKEDSMPFQFMSKMASDNDYFLGAYKGKYILQDALDINDIRYQTFNNLQDVSTFLKNTPRHTLRPDFAKEVSAEAVEATGHNIKDPLQDIPYEEIKSSKKYGIGFWFDLETRPTPYAVKHLENLKVSKTIRNKFGTSATRMYHVLEDSNRLRSAFENDANRRVARMTKGIRPKESEKITDYIEAIEKQGDEIIDGHTYLYKQDVFDDMVENFGSKRANELVERSVEIENYFRDLFSHSDMPWSMFIKHYAPHYSDMIAMKKGKFSANIDHKSITQIPNPHKDAFFEMLRDVDHREIMWEKDITKLLKVYTHLTGRNMFMRPALDKVKGDLKNIMNGMSDMKTDSDDYKLLVHYMSNIMASIEGVSNPAERASKYAMSRTVESLTEQLESATQGKIKLKTSADPISKLITLSTGAHIAARPYPIARNLTQTMITTFSLIGPRFGLEGADRLFADPSAMLRLMDNGIIEKVQMPTGAGYSINPEGLIAKAMEGYKFSDWINRSIAYLGMENRVDDAVARFKAGKISKKKFLHESGAKLFGRNEYNEAVRLLNTSPNRDAAYAAFKDRLSRLATERSQYLYHKFDTPELFRSGVGRLFGQYTTWPLNFFNLIRSSITSDSMTVADKAKFLSSVGLVTTALSKGAHSAGMNPKAFIPWEMGMMGPGPYYKMLNDSIMAVNGDQRAYMELVDNLTSFLPFVYASEGVYKATQAFQEGRLQEGTLLLMSTPMNYDKHPRRDTPIDSIKDAMIEGGNKYFESKQKGLWGDK